jgi:integrase/recombinase XerD
MKATIKIEARNTPRADGRHTLWLRATYQRKRKYFPLGRACFPSEWNEEAQRFRKNHPDWAAENDMLRTYEQRAADVIRSFERDGLAFSFEVFERAVFTGKDKSGGGALKLVDYLRSIKAELREAGKFGNSTFYGSTADVIRAFRPKATLSDLNEDWLTKFEAWQRRERGMADGGVSVNMRVLRSACNRAVKSKLMPADWYPFAAYSLSHLQSGNVKRAISLEEMRRLESLEVDAFDRFALDLFLFSFYCRGMNFADIAELTVGSIRDMRIVYERKKTGKSYSVPVSAKAGAILDRYRRRGEDYLFPIFTTGAHTTDQQKFNRTHKVKAQVNAALKRLAVMAGISPVGFVFYSARHSYATALKMRGVGVEMIAEALGHSDIKTTELYLKSFGDNALDAMDRLLD